MMLDPFLLTQPAPADWHDALQALTTWSSAVSAGDDVYYSQTCTGKVMSEGLYAYANAFELDPHLKVAGQGVSARDVITVVNRLLARAKPIESRCETVLCAHVALTPPSLSTRFGSTSLADCFTDALVAFWLLHEPPCSSVVLGSRPDHHIPTERTDDLDANLAAIEGYPERSPALPIDVKCSVEIRFREPARSIGLAELVADPKEAIATEYRRLPLSERADFPLRPFSVGTDFLMALQAVNCDERLALIILKQVVRIFSGQAHRFPSMKIHPERVGPGPNDAQRERADGSKAFRAELTSHGAGYRLLYWQKGPAYELWTVRTESQH